MYLSCVPAPLLFVEPFVAPLAKEHHVLLAVVLSPFALLLVACFLARQVQARGKTRVWSFRALALDIVLCAAASLVSGAALLLICLSAGMQM
jgi:hypothetical protein